MLKEFPVVRKILCQLRAIKSQRNGMICVARRDGTSVVARALMFQGIRWSHAQILKAQEKGARNIRS